MRKFNLILATILSFILLNEVSIRPQNGNFSEWLTNEGSIAYARRSSGGRSRGGSFSRPSRSSGSSSRPSRSSGSRSSGSRSSGSSSSPSRSSGSSSSGSSSSGSRSSGSRSSGSSSSSPSRSSGSSSSTSNSSGSSSSSSSSVQDSVSPSSSPATSTSTPSSNSSRGQTGGRSRSGSFNKPTVTPTPVTPNSNNNRSSSPTVPVSPSTGTSRGTTYVPVVPHSRPNSVELEIENNTIIVPPSQPVRQPYIAPVPVPNYSDNPENAIENSEVAPGTVTSPNSTLQPVPVNAAPNAPTNAAPTSTTVAPSNSAQSKGFPWGWVLFLLVTGGGVAIAWYLLATANELDNDTVTVTKLQIALLANARDLQSDLTELSDRADFDSPEGRVEFLQEAALSLLRQPEYWSHALSSSETVKSREQAGQVFEQLSIAERSKFSAETFSNVQGQVREREGVSGGDDDEPAAYIVVTLLIGTEDDRPLFDPIHSTEELQQALQRVAAITTDYLLTIELLWTPQQDTDSLSYDRLLTGYADMVQL